MPKNNYNQIVKTNFENKTKEILKDMPIFINLYFDAKSEKMSYKTLLGYAYDIQKFLYWAKDDLFPECNRVEDITIVDFSTILPHDVERYILYLQSDARLLNSGVSIRRKISSLSSIYNFLCDHLYLDENPCKEVEYPDIVVPNNDVLTDSQIIKIINKINDTKESFSNKQNFYLEKTKERDYTILTLLLTTGIRINELVALDVSSIDFKRRTLRVDRGVDIFLPVSDNTLKILDNYKKNRVKNTCNETALFLSMQNKRLCTQAIEDMLHKYTKPLKLDFDVTPKMLRHTFAANLYKETANADLINSYMGKRKVEEIKILMNHLSGEHKKDIYKSLNGMYKNIFKEKEE